MRRSSGLGLLSALLLAAAALLAQNLGYRQDANWQAPAQAAARANPLAPTPEIVAGGRKLFQRHCAECHGEDGGGLRKAADLQLPAVQQQSDGVLFWKITNGNSRRKMPSWARLPELQRWQLVLYLRTLAPPAQALGAPR
jgi:mono/diheme cytochrome c family protein